MTKQRRKQTQPADGRAPTKARACSLLEMNEANGSSELLDKDQFLGRLRTLFETTNKDKKNSVWMTHKRLTYGGGDTNMTGPADEPDSNEYACIIKATNGKGAKISTQVKPSELDSFYVAYGSLLKASMPSLKKRDKKKEKARHEQTLLRRKRLEEDVILAGPKRGKGRRQYQRKLKAVITQTQIRSRIAEREKDRAEQRTA
ncbi:uncharacterized protein EI90DRAFT_3152618 [Cantharellus anzutake]|uniref:uncharacterized protein n=1 Tax=Cantharellus anzutake TaxID=1750568 RepID=UPI0019081DB4|nr:uncharacterized protein EI90DRAFT_3152618 [Cantharellus anzutake]KAF8336459.1 hypothetical protein EI90DRAFT_3152618 [Cantharellus anzutake]